MKPYSRNPRRITDKRQQRLAETLARLGDLGGIVHNLETDEVIGGNQRMAVFKDGEPVVVERYDSPDDQGTVGHGFVVWRGHRYAYRQVRWDAATAAEANIAANIGAGEWDWDILKEWDAGDLKAYGFEADLLKNWRADAEALEKMLAEDAPAVGEDPGAQVDKAAELQAKWQTATGQLWALGEHRLICGDCTDKQAVAQLMAGEHAWLGVTSPPYAVGKGYEIGVTFSQHLALLRAMADRALEAIEPGGFFFVNFGEIAPQSVTRTLTKSRRQCVYPISKDYWQIFHVERGFDLYAQRIWYKPFNRLQKPFWTYRTSIPHHQEWEHIWLWRCPGGDDDAGNLENYALEDDPGGEWEYIWTMRLPGGEDDQRFLWAISSRAVWDTRREATNDKPLTRHEAAFPVCLPERALLAHSAVGAIIYEPFSGSGTTLIACERLGRRCRAVEIEPGYVAVALERWSTMTGQTPVLLNPAAPNHDAPGDDKQSHDDEEA